MKWPNPALAPAHALWVSGRLSITELNAISIDDLQDLVEVVIAHNEARQ
jgi:hypothetical protein